MSALRIAPRAVVTGASSGIGRATALALARAGLEVLAVARREPELERLAAEAPERIRPLVADVTSADDRVRIREALRGEPLGALVHGAGVFPRGPLSGVSADDWRAAMATNVDARLHLVQELAPSLRGGRVLFVGSDAATTPRAGGAVYSISKAASLMLWRCLAVELGDEITFAMAKPGLVATDMLEGSLAAPRDAFPAGEVYEAMCARGETVAPETVARFFRWLLLETDAAELGADGWDIRDQHHHARWLEGPLYTPRGR
ncbi:MAG: SDR family oxidoreductase [Deltaproteobacteria bacterium]|nr:SDR family oxidoreductase [Deltaproteobacteria bacterium]